MPAGNGTGTPAFSPADSRPMAGALLDAPRPTAGALLVKADRMFAELLKRFDNLLAFSRAETSDVAAAAAHRYQMSVETEGLIKAATDILELTRTLKQLWIQGELKVVKQANDQNQNEELFKTVDAIGSFTDSMLANLSRGGST